MGLGDKFKKLFESSKKEEKNFKSLDKKDFGIVNETIEESSSFESKNLNEIEEEESENAVEKNYDGRAGSEKTRNFKFLDELIHKGVKEIILDSNIVLEKSEESEYSYGIKLDVDDLIIRGQGHLIDAKKNAQIFNVTGRNITLENITFYQGNGKSGGAIYNTNSGSLTIKNCNFRYNSSDKDGGAVFNDGVLTFFKCCFKSNEGNNDGGAIFNSNGDLYIKSSNFNHNVSKRYGGAIHNSHGNLTLNKCCFDNNQSKTDQYGISKTGQEAGKGIKGKSGGAVFNGNDSTLTIESCNFERNISKEHGGAVFNEGNLSILKCNFKSNKAESWGGAVYSYGYSNINESNFKSNKSKGGGAVFNRGNLSIQKCHFKSNKSKGDGGAINHGIGELNLNKSSFTANKSTSTGGVLWNGSASKILGCEFFGNNSHNNLIHNEDYLLIYNSDFNDNHSSEIILNKERFKGNAILGVFYSNFIGNSAKKAVILNATGMSCSVDGIILEKNLYIKNSMNIINESDLTLHNLKIMDQGKTIFNSGYIFIKDYSSSIENKIEGDGVCESYNQIPSSNFDFGYLDKKIQESTTKEIVLEEDICFENYERDFYEGGIELDIDNLIIDGNGKTIDGAGKSRIFIITGDNIVLKNIKFKNGRMMNNYDNRLNESGGALEISPNINIKIENCEFIKNNAWSMGGAIDNSGILTIVDSNFESNKAEIKYGGAISNIGILHVENSIFKDNFASDGGAISSKGKICVEGSRFENNWPHGQDGAIFLRGSTKIESNNCEFIENAK